MFNMKQPLNPIIDGKINGAAIAIRERQQVLDNMVHYFIDLWFDDVDINDSDIQMAVFSRYGLKDITRSEMEYVREQVERALE